MSLPSQNYFKEAQETNQRPTHDPDQYKSLKIYSYRFSYKRNLIKNIRSVYLAKGTAKANEVFFKMLFKSSE